MLTTGKRKTILICPLEWGLGHAGRMIPVAKALLESGHRIFIGAGSLHQEFFKSEMNGLEFINFAGFRPSYSRRLPQYLSIALKIPSILVHILREHQKLKKIINGYQVDIVISDNRFGLWNKKVKTVYITHQLLIPFPKRLRFLEWTGVLFHEYFIRKYDLCLVPDLPGEINLAGRLSHPRKLLENTRYIGILSRFSDMDEKSGDLVQENYNTLVLSGPEPQKSLLGKMIINCQDGTSPPLVILEGKPGAPDRPNGTGKLIFHGHLPTIRMGRILKGSSAIIARAGYSTIMELISINRTALLIPTPGQTEQEYLADYLSAKGWFTTISQKDIKTGLSFSSDSKALPKVIVEESRSLFKNALEEILDQEDKQADPQESSGISNPYL